MLACMGKVSGNKKFCHTDERGRVGLAGLNPANFYEARLDTETGIIELHPVTAVPAYLAQNLREAAGSGALGR